jgi:hypothetical protein
MGLSKDYDHEKRIKRCKLAILGLERAKLTGRIEDTRIEMAARIVKLREVPGLHAEKISAIDKAHWLRKRNAALLRKHCAGCARLHLRLRS